MNFIGKLLVGLICAMSLIFMTFAVVVHSTHKNWKVEHTKKLEELKTSKDEYSRLQTAKISLEEKFQDELTRRIAAIDALKTEVTKMDENLATLAQDKQQLIDEQQTVITSIVIAHENLSQYRAELESLRQNMRKAQEDWAKQQTDLIAKTDEAQGLSLRLATYRAVSDKLARDYRDAIEVLRKFNLQANPSLYNEEPPRGMEGTVTEVRPNGWVEISIGTDAGVMKGQRLDVWRGANEQSSYIGKIEVVRTEADKAACIILPEYRRGTVQRDDSVGHIDLNEPSVK